MGNKKIEITIVMPALNEEKNAIPTSNNTLKALEDYKISGEIIVINDGSRDSAEDLVAAIMQRDKRVSMIRHETPCGIGASFWKRIDNTRGDIVTRIPCDNENNSWEVFRYFRLLEHVDIVIPFVFNKEAISLFRNMLSFIYRVIVNTTFGVNFNYTNSTVLFCRSILGKLNYRSCSFFFQTDILIRAVKKGYLFAEVPYRLGLRNEGTSKMINFPSLMQVIKGYLRLVIDFICKI